ncbi:ABC transporter ATP-binding protein [Bacillaceae bacterium S4-13-58]
MISVKNVGKTYRNKKVIHEVSFDIKKGESICLLGPNGAGKTTLLKMLASVENHTKGSITYLGVPLKKSFKKLRKQSGYVSQEIVLYEEMKVKDQIQFWQKITKKKASSEYINETIQLLRLHDVWDERTENLSGGWKRKLHLCVGMIHEPEICFLDEPTAGVDIAARLDIIKWLKKLHEQGMTLIFISHHWDEMKQLGERILLLENGELLFDGSETELDQNIDRLIGNASTKELASILEAKQ